MLLLGPPGSLRRQLALRFCGSERESFLSVAPNLNPPTAKSMQFKRELYSNADPKEATSNPQTPKPLTSPKTFKPSKSPDP